MSRITKEIAKEVALKLTSKKFEEYQVLIEELSLKTFELYSATIPKEIIESSKKFPDYFDFSHHLNVTGNGFSYDQIKISEKSVVKSSNKYYTPQPQDAKALMAVKNKIEDARKSYKDLVFEIENLVYHLRTYAKVAEQFPEAVPFLPNKAITTALAINIDDIRKKL
jgi:hypothetical protein